MPSAIEWTEETWNPVTGCSKVSPGCAHCYAETLTARFAGWPGYIEEHRPWTPENAAHNVRLHSERLDQPLRWRAPRTVFVNSMSDLFHEEIPYEFVRDVFNVMRRCDGSIIAATGKPSPSHTFQVLTKRPEHALELWRTRRLGFDTWPPHVWLGVSIENARYTWRADVLREIPTAVRFISAEPLLGSLFTDKTPCRSCGYPMRGGDLCGDCRAYGPPAERRVWKNTTASLDLTGIDWLIVGGESGGRQARPMHPDWARELRDACLDAEVAYFHKQNGSWAEATLTNIDRAKAHRFLQPDGEDRTKRPLNEHDERTAHMVYLGASPKSGGRLLDGREWNEMPEARVLAAR
jgi:protein gp37